MYPIQGPQIPVSSKNGEFDLISDYLGYFNKQDVTNIDPRSLVYGSQNMILNDAEKWQLRGGLTLDGQSNFTLAGIVASYDWITSGNVERNLRAYQDNLEYRYVDPITSAVTWRTLQSGWGSDVNFNFAEWYDSGVESKDYLLMVNGTSSVWAWTGAVGTIQSVSNNTGIISTWAIGSMGSGYQVGDTITVGGAGSGATATVISAGSGGASGIIDDIFINNPGTGYVIGDMVTISGGSTNAQIKVTGVGNGSSTNGVVTGVTLTSAGTGYQKFTNIPAVEVPNGSGVTGSGSGVAFSITGISATGAITSFSVDLGGQNYTVGDTVQLLGYGNGNAVFTISSVTTNTTPGPVTFFTVTNPGTNYAVAYNVTTTGGTGTGLTMNITQTSGAGDVTGLQFTNYGQNYSVTNGVATTTSGAGSSLTINITAVVANSITLQGTTNWAQNRFLIGGGSVVIDGLTYSYTTGTDTQTISGVFPDPTADNPPVGSIVHQALVETSNWVSDKVNPGIIGVNNNQVYTADLSQRNVYISKNISYTDFTFGSPRLVGDGDVLTLGANPIGFSIQNADALNNGSPGDMWIFCAINQIYDCVTSTFPITDTVTGVTITSESITPSLLKINPGQGALTQSGIGYAKDSVVYITHDKAVDSLSRLQNSSIPMTNSLYINSTSVPNLFPISDPVKYEFLEYNYDIPTHIKYNQYKLYVTVPSSSRMMVYDYQKALWYTPWVLSAGRIAVIAGQTYIHSSTNPETFVLLSGTNDNGNPIHGIMATAYRSYNDRSQNKSIDEWFTEGYISGNATITMTLNYDYGGSTATIMKEIAGTPGQNILFAPLGDSHLGKNPLGEFPLGSLNFTPSDLSKFRVVHELDRQDFYEIQAIYETNDIDFQWQILAIGGNVKPSTTENQDIKQ